ncbi:MAG: hypothetical protein ACPGYY_03005, partial [Bacteroidia bacterium]
MRVKTTLALAWLVWIGLDAQSEVSTIQKFGIIGTKKLENKLLVLSKGDFEDIDITAFSSKGSKLWQNSMMTDEPAGNHVNKIEILGNSISIYILQNLPKHTVVTVFSTENGDEIKEYITKPKPQSGRWTLVQDELHLLTIDNNQLLRTNCEEEEELTEEAILFPSKYQTDKYRVHAIQGRDAVISSNVLEPNHGGIHLYLSKFDCKTGDTIQNEIDLTLEHSSFTYNSSIDKNVYGITSSPTGFHLTGKLDVPFKRKYPSQKVGDSFIGIWIAKFDWNLRLIYFREIPFGALNRLVSNDVINKPTLIQVKEDANQGLFVTLNELQGALYGKKYFVYLDNKGNPKTMLSTADQFHFYAFDKSGLRNSAKKIKVRMVNDDWSYYSNQHYTYFYETTDLFSLETNKVLSMNAKDENCSIESKAYTYFTFNDQTFPNLSAGIAKQ